MRYSLSDVCFFVNEQIPTSEINLKNYIAELGSEVVYDTGREVYMTYDKKDYKYEILDLFFKK